MRFLLLACAFAATGAWAANPSFVPATGSVLTSEVIIAEAVTLDTAFHRSAARGAVMANVSTAHGWLARYYLATANHTTKVSVYPANGTTKCVVSEMKGSGSGVEAMPLPSLWSLDGFTRRGLTSFGGRPARIYRDDRDRYLQLMLVDESTGDVLFRSAPNYGEAQGVIHSVIHDEPDPALFTPPAECDVSLRQPDSVVTSAAAADTVSGTIELWRKWSCRDWFDPLHLQLGLRAPPVEVDNRAFATPVRDQGQCGCCWSVATAGLAEVVANVARNTTVPAGNVSGWLSFQSLVDCVHGDANFVPTRGCLGGNPITSIEWVAANGIATEATYNYDGINGVRCKIADPGVDVVRPLSRAIVVPPFNATAMAQAVAQYGAVTASIRALPDYERWAGGAVYDDPACGIGFDHVILIVGYGVDEASGLPYWLVKNSHGPGWADAGYYRIRRGVNMCGVETIPVTATAFI